MFQTQFRFILAGKITVQITPKKNNGNENKNELKERQKRVGYTSQLEYTVSFPEFTKKYR